MITPTMASGAQFKICPLCEESRLVFSGLNEARCTMCDHEPDDDFLKTLRQSSPTGSIGDLAEPATTGTVSPKKGGGEQKKSEKLIKQIENQI